MISLFTKNERPKAISKDHSSIKSERQARLIKTLARAGQVNQRTSSPEASSSETSLSEPSSPEPSSLPELTTFVHKAAYLLTSLPKTEHSPTSKATARSISTSSKPITSSRRLTSRKS